MMPDPRVKYPEAALRQAALADARVAALLGDRVYPLQAAQGAKYPLAILSRVASDYAGHIAGREIGGVHRALVQCDIFAEAYGQAKEIAAALAGALVDLHAEGEHIEIRSVRLTSEQDALDNPRDGKGEGIYRVVQEYEVWYR